MQESPLPFSKTEVTLRTADLPIFSEGWLLACDGESHSEKTCDLRRFILNKLHWFLTKKEYSTYGVLELRAFFSYLRHGHKEPGGRWGNGLLTNPAKPGTVATYDRHLRTFFSWLVKEERISQSPMDKINPPKDRPDQIEPFTEEEVNALIAAAKNTCFAKRDEAILWFLLDTGVRASELCALKFEDVDFSQKRVKIQEGKGGKSRLVWIGKTATKALWNYCALQPHDSSDPLFFNRAGQAFTRSGLLQLIERLGEAACIQQTRCSPHTFRHTFAVSFLRAGGNVLTLQQLLGHTSLTQVNRYVKLAQADLQNAHRQFSPADRLTNRKRAAR